MARFAAARGAECVALGPWLWAASLVMSIVPQNGVSPLDDIELNSAVRRVPRNAEAADQADVLRRSRRCLASTVHAAAHGQRGVVEAQVGAAAADGSAQRAPCHL